MSDPLVQVEMHDATAVLRINLPSKRNALVIELREALIDELDAQMRSPSCRVIVLTGSGGSFCAGGDLDALRDHDPLGVRTRMQRGQQLIRQIVTGPKPVIAAVNGTAHGAGLSIAAACDFVIAADSAKFGAVFGKIGLMADLGLLWSLPRRVGFGVTRRMLYGAAVVDADEALAIGLADERATDGELMTAALGHSQRLSSAPPVAVAMTKGALARSCASLEEAFGIELDGQTLLFSTDDHVEGRDAFRERRTAQFQGR